MVRAAALVLGLCACATPPPPTPPPAVGFATVAGLVFVELQGPGDAPLLALLDTGANASAIDARRAADLPAVDAVDVLGTTGSLRAERVRLDGLELAGTPLPPLLATRRDLGGLLAPPGRRVDMILGTDALRGRVLALDFAAQRLALPEHLSVGLRVVPMGLDEGIPTLPARLCGTDLRLRLDTGASLFATEDVYVNLPRRVFAAVLGGRVAGAPVATLAGTGADGTSVPLPVHRLAPAQIGPRALPAAFAIVQPEAGYFARPDALGFVSNNFLARLGRVELDFGTGQFACAP